MKVIIDLCEYYDVCNLPFFKPVCKKGHKANLKCHSQRKDCSDYIPSVVFEDKK